MSDPAQSPDDIRRPILIAGPTASGKSALALALAERLGGAVINADSQQVFAEWRILSARPTEAEMQGVPHLLYGHVPVARDYSLGDWLAEVTAALAECRARGLTPILAGGTGLYFKALTEGLAEIPPIAPATRQAAEARLAETGLAALAAELNARDPATAAAIDLANPARVLRAWEVLAETGRGLAAWQAKTGPPLLPLADCLALALAPERDVLYARCEARFDQMMTAGALAEVAAIEAMDLSAGRSGRKLVGAPELAAHLRGEIPLEEAVARAKTATRRYAKRQLTWIRNQMRHWQTASTPEEARALAMRRAPDPAP